MKKHFFFLFLMMVLAVGCGKKGTSELQNSVSDEATEVGLGVIGASMDDVSGEVDTDGGSSIASYGIAQSQAVAPVCYARAITDECNNGIKTAEYNSCRLPFSRALLSGSVTLTFSDNACSLEAVESSVTRTKDLTFSGYFGAELKRFSRAKENFRGNEIGGGSVLTRTSNGYSLEILGIHEELQGPRDAKLRDVSVRTVRPLEFQGGLLRRNRRLVSGSLEVSHNLAQFIATYTAQDLTWSAECCYPVAGTLNVTYEGSLNGEGSVAFNSCGKVTVTRNGEVNEVTLRECE